MDKYEKGKSLKPYWVKEGDDSYVLNIFSNSHDEPLYSNEAWTSTIGSSYKKVRLVKAEDHNRFPFFVLMDREGNFQNLAFVRRITTTCIPEKQWFVCDIVIAPNLNNMNDSHIKEG